MNISKPDTNSEVYKAFIGMINQKVSEGVVWLINHNIEYVWNYWVDNHLYRLYIPEKDLILDFEYYPVNNLEYNYIRVNFDTDIVKLLEYRFPIMTLETQDLEVYKLNQRPANNFLRENDASPVYDKKALRLGYVKDGEIYRCMVIKNNQVIRDVTKRGYSISLGTYMLLRCLNEQFGFSGILIKENTGNSYVNNLYQILNTPIVAQTHKKKIWWSPNGAKWKIKKEDTNKYTPFYYCEDVIYKYG